MRLRIEFYVALVVALAAGAFAVVVVQDPTVSSQSLSAIALLALLALVAEALSYLLPMASKGSIAFIPYFAIVLVAPSWPALVAIAAVRAVTDINARRGPTKGIFNVAVHVLWLAVAIWMYRSLSGESLISVRGSSLLDATVATGGPAIVSMGTAYVLNGLLVCAAIAISQGITMGDVWRKNLMATLWLDLLSLPLIFVFAWVYARFGAIAAAASWVPILGLRQVHKINLELERTNEELLELMVKSMEARDPYTSGHSRRVHHYSTIIARALDIAERDVSVIGRAALLHDVGKIHEKYGPILAKAERLTPEEWAVIQAHPVDGANLVATMSRLKDVVGPIRSHHENWDGTGYPDGLAGDLIPAASRIIRFADTIDAMTTDRPYRSSLSEAQVRAELVKCRGRQFDPVITDKLLSSPLWSQLFAQGDSAGEARPKLTVMTGARAAG